MGKRLAKLVAVLDEGPCTSAEIAAETGVPLRLVAAHLSKAFQWGIVDRHRAPMSRGDEKRGQVPYLYRLRP